jgi:tRNA1Val (adenine37-N6)-methyltransferase
VPVDLPYTVDALFEGRVPLLQPARGHGYRVNVDAILLAAFAANVRSHAGLVVDLGAGVGAVSLSLCQLATVDRLVLVERDEAVAALAQRNLELNSLAERGVVHVGDLAIPLSTQLPAVAASADLVVSNPPYTRPARMGLVRPPRSASISSTPDGSIPSRSSRDDARSGELAPFVRAMSEALGRRGKGCLVYPAQDLVELLMVARSFGLEPKRLRFVHGRPERPARVALVEVAHARDGGLVVMPPLLEMDQSGNPSPELDALLRPRALRPT